MPVTTTYPGVYIEEVPSGVRSIAGVSTSVTAFIGYTVRGPLHEPVQIFSFADFERQFGGLHRDSELSYAVHQYFLNQGRVAYVVRVARGAAKASVTLKTGVGAGDAPILEIEARTHGQWGNTIQIDVDYATPRPDMTFNLSLTEHVEGPNGATIGRSEAYLDLSMDSASPDYVERKVNAVSDLVRVKRLALPGGIPKGWSLSKSVAAFAGGLDDDHRFIGAMIDGVGPVEIPLFPPGGGPAISTPDLLRAALEGALATVPEFNAPPVTLTTADGTGAGSHLKVTANTPGATPAERSSVRLFSAGAKDAATRIGLGVGNGGREGGGAAVLRPACTGTVSGDLAVPPAWGTIDAGHDIVVRVVTPSGNIERTVKLGEPVDSLAKAAERLQKVIREGETRDAFRQMAVSVQGTRLRLATGPTFASSQVRVLNGGAGTAATLLKIEESVADENVQRYAPGVGPTKLAQVAGNAGKDGAQPEAGDLTGNEALKQGLYALESVDIFNLLCIPRTAALNDDQAGAVAAEALAYAARRRAFCLVDPPGDKKTKESIKAWVQSKLPPHRNGAVYFPQVVVADPLDGYRPRQLPPSGAVAGVYARTDAERGVWKAPAGTDAVVLGTLGLASELTDAEHGTLNPYGVNVLRRLPNFGTVVWGSRTLDGADDRASEWKYVPVRRTSLFLEESLYRGTHWVVFEPNDEPLWAQIRLNVGAFMDSLFRQGAFAGASPKEAYFVRCDATTTTRDDRNRGVVNIVVGWAPLKPAEFVILRFTQLAGPPQS